MNAHPAQPSSPLKQEARHIWLRSVDAIAGRSPQRGDPSTQPVSHYLDPDRLAQEQALLKTLPMPVAPLDQLARAGDWFSTRVHGVPVLLTRDASGGLNAFINVCRHRGAVVAPEEAAGQGKTRFVCPYHSWTYDAGGGCIGRPHEADFPHVPREAAGLVALPVVERLGMAWVIATPSNEMAGFDWDAYFGPIGNEVAALGYDGAAFSPERRRFVQPSNWKLVLEGNLESYHFQYAHQKTVAPIFHDNMVVHEHAGDHHKIVLPKRTLTGVPETIDMDLVGRHTHIIYFFFPCAFMLWEGDHIDLFTVSPTDVDHCDVRGWMLVPERFRHRSAEHWQKNDFLFWETLDEDFALAASIQSGLRSGANDHFQFGRNEFACALFNESLAQRLP